VIGRGEQRGVIWATGHYRNGVLLTPITAEAVAELLTGGEPPAAVSPFTPERFGVGVR
jgi:glycine oxidase